MKTIFITGGTRGIGRAIVEKCIGKFNVVFTYKNSKDIALELQNMHKNDGVIDAVYCDIEDEKSIQEAVQYAINKYKHIDVLVNNAGISKSGLFIDQTMVDFSKVMNINFMSMVSFCHKIIPNMIQQEKGCIINISSIWGEVGASCEALYSASKGAVISFSKAIAKEYAGASIRVNVVSPGATDTDMMKEYSQEEIEDVIEEIPVGRLANPSEIADAVLFLISNEYITGEVLRVNGGRVI